MTKKDYVLIAGVIKTKLDIWKKAKTDWEQKASVELTDEALDKIDTINKIIADNGVLVEGLSHQFKIDNPQFDKNKFFEACGIGELD